MIQLVLILVIACTLLLVVGLLLWDAFGRHDRRQRRDDGRDSGIAPPLPAQLPSRDLMDRIFAEDDLSFVAGLVEQLTARLDVCTAHGRTAPTVASQLSYMPFAQP